MWPLTNNHSRLAGAGPAGPGVLVPGRPAGAEPGLGGGPPRTVTGTGRGRGGTVTQAQADHPSPSHGDAAMIKFNGRAAGRRLVEVSH